MRSWKVWCSGDNKALEDTEFEINRMEEYVLQDKAGSDFNMELLHKKKELSVFATTMSS